MSMKYIPIYLSKSVQNMNSISSSKIILYDFVGIIWLSYEQVC